jgi:ABC-type nitrate/sulfonate/bicarbonate transport system substrate-binding protein
MRKKPGIVLPILLTLVGLAVLVGCSSSSPSPSAKETVIKVSHQPYIHGLPTYMAMQKGWDKAEGLNIDFQLYMSGPPQNEALASNTWEVGAEGSPPAMLAAIRYGAYIIAVADDQSQINNLWVRPNSPILKVKGFNPKYPDIYGSPQTFKGKTILLTTASTGHYAVLATLRALGVNEQEVKLVHMEPQQILPAFEAGQGDIAQLWSPFDYAADKKGFKEISCGKWAGVAMPGMVVASKKAFEENPDKVAKWLKLYLRGNDAIKADPKESAKLLGAFSKAYGLTMDDKDLAEEMVRRPVYSGKEQLALFAKKDGASSQVEQWMSNIADFFVQQGRLSPADKDKLLKGNLINDKILKMVVQ